MLQLNQRVETLHGAKGYARGVVVQVPQAPYFDQVRVLVDQVAGENRVFENVRPFESNYVAKYTR